MAQSGAGVKEEQKVATAKKQLETNGQISAGKEMAWALLDIAEKLAAINLNLARMSMPKPRLELHIPPEKS
jgi:uncharacterized membrane protein YccC